jgi:hypothetical protein
MGCLHTYVWELDRILNEENRDVVSDEVPVTLVGVELNSEPTHVSNSISASSATLNGGKSNKHGGVPRGIGQNASHCHVFGALLQPEGSEGTSSTGVNDSLGDTLMVESMNLSIWR